MFRYTLHVMPGYGRNIGSRPGRLAAAVLLLALLTLGLWKFLRSENSLKASAPPAVPVAVAQVRQQDVPHLVDGIGTVQSLHSVIIRPQVEGVLTVVLFKEGEFVRRGELLARIDDRAIAATLEEARAQKAQNQAELQVARQILARYRNLLQDEAISRQEVEQQKALVERLEATIRANQAVISAAQVQLSYTRIASPIDGRVGIRRVDPGNLVRLSDAEGLVTVTQIDPIGVFFSLPQEQLPRIHPLLDDPLGAPVTALDRDTGTELAQGRLTIVDNEIDPRTGTIRLKAEFPNPHGRLWPGQFVTARLRTGLTPKALVVPAVAVQRGLEQPFVYRVKNGKVEAVPVTVEHADDEIAVIGRGVVLGDMLVSDGHSRLKPGAAVKIVPTSAGRGGGSE